MELVAQLVGMQSVYARGFRAMEVTAQELRTLVGDEVIRRIRRNFVVGRRSLPGQPPGVVTGNLRASVGYVTVSDRTIRIGVGRNAIYGVYLERGSRPVKKVAGRVMPMQDRYGWIWFRLSRGPVLPRPFVEPAVREVLSRLNEIGGKLESRVIRRF